MCIRDSASPAIYFDSYGHAVVPLLGGIAIRDLNAEETTTLGYFSPKQHDGGGYVIQSSYTFLDLSLIHIFGLRSPAGPRRLRDSDAHKHIAVP